MKLSLIIDSTEFRKDRNLNKYELTRIKELGREGLIELHIPWFVFKECTTTFSNDLEKDLQKSRTLLSRMENKGLHGDGSNALRNLVVELDKFSSSIHTLVEQTWYDFINESNAVLHDFKESDSKVVFESYFKGSPPFQTLKNRNDIPDAFIYETIKQMKSTVKELHFVSSDSNLRVKCRDELGVVCHSSFEELFNYSSFCFVSGRYTELRMTKLVDNNRKIIIDSRDQFQSAVEEYFDFKTFRFFTFQDENIPSDDNHATVYSVDAIQTQLDGENIHFADGQFFVPLIINAIASVDYPVSKADYWAEGYSLNIAEELNKHYYLIEDTLRVVMYKTVTIKMSEISEDEGVEVTIDEIENIHVFNDSEN